MDKPNFIKPANFKEMTEEQQKEIRALPLSRRWEYHRDNKKWIRECKEYRQKNPYQCFTVKLIMANK